MGKKMDARRAKADAKRIAKKLAKEKKKADLTLKEKLRHRKRMKTITSM